MDEKELRYAVLKKLAYKNMSFKELFQTVDAPEDELKVQLSYLRKRKLIGYPDEHSALIDLIKPKYNITQAGFKYLDELETPSSPSTTSQFVVHAENIGTLVQANTINKIDIDAVFLEINQKIDNDQSLSTNQKERLKSKFDALKRVLKEIKDFGSPIATQLVAEVLKKVFGLGT